MVWLVYHKIDESAVRSGKPPRVRFGSEADICAAKSHVRFAPESGHVRRKRQYPLWANSRHGRASFGHQTVRLNTAQVANASFESALINHRCAGVVCKLF